MQHLTFLPTNEQEFNQFKNSLFLEFQQKLLDSKECETKEDATPKINKIFEENLPLDRNSSKNFINKIISNEGKHIGYVWILINNDDQPKVARLAFIYIFEHYRGVGVGESVMLSLEKELASKYQCHDLELNVFRSNKVAINLYNKLNFSTVIEKCTRSRIEMTKRIHLQ